MPPRTIAFLLTGIACAPFVTGGKAMATDFVVPSGGTADSVEMLDPDDVGLIRAGGTVTGNSTGIGVKMGDDPSDTDQILTNDGTISVIGSGYVGIQSNGDRATINVGGTINATSKSLFGSIGIQADGDDAVINMNGDINTSGGIGGYGIASSGARANIDVGGSIMTTGTGGYGIFSFGPDAVIDVSGTIGTSGTGALGINSQGDDAQIRLGGAIETLSTDASGIESSGDGVHIRVDRTGEISTQGRTAHGIAAIGLGPVIDMDGRISLSGIGSVGVYVTSLDAMVDVDGSIETFNSGSHAVRAAGNGGEYFLSGQLHVHGPGSYAIYVTGEGNAVNVDGYAVSDQSDALFVSGADNSVLFAAPAYLGGRLYSSVDTAVSIRTGASHSVLWDFSDVMMTGGQPSISGPVPWFYNSSSNLFATYDPTAFRADFEFLGDLAGQISRLGRSRLGAVGASATSTHAAMMPGAANPYATPTRYWIAGFGGRFDHAGDSMTLDTDINQAGVVLGANWSVSPEFEFGLLGGYVEGNISSASRWTRSVDTEINGWFAGATGRLGLGTANLDFALTGGVLRHDQSRFVNDNLALSGGATLGKSWAESDYGSWFLAPELALSTDFESGGWTYTPSAGIRYAAQWLDGYTESGSNANARVSDRAYGLLEGQVEIEASKAFAYGTFAARLGYQARTAIGDNDATVTLIGQTESVGFGAADTGNAYAGATASLDLGATMRLELDGEVRFGGDTTGYGGTAKLVAAF